MLQAMHGLLWYALRDGKEGKMPNRDIYTKLGTIVKEKCCPRALIHRPLKRGEQPRLRPFGLTSPRKNIYTHLGIFDLQWIHESESFSPNLRRVQFTIDPSGDAFRGWRKRRENLMRSRAFLMFLLPVLLVLASVVSGTPSPEGDDALLGRWDITAWDAKSHLPINCWLELTRQQGVLKGRFNEGSGAVFDLPQVAIENRKLTFMYPEGHPPNVTRQVWQAALKNGALAGTADVDGQKLSWTGERGPLWPTNPRMMKPGAPLDLFNGKDVSNWLCQDPHHPMGWFVKDGILMNVGKDACNIYTRRKFNDFKLDVEFNVDPQSNSGVYLRGRYEIQILDGYRRPMDVHSQGALYGFIVPSAKADKPAGEW